jgi:hypothetical protein
MLVPNCIFRSNGAAVLLSNKPTESWCAPGAWGASSGRLLSLLAGVDPPA